MSALGPKRTSVVAPHMFAFGAKQTCPVAPYMSAKAASLLAGLRVLDPGRRRIANDDPLHRRLRTHQQIKCDDVRNHQQRDVNDRDHVGGTQLSCQGWKAELGGVIIVDDEVGRAHEVEGDNEQPKDRTYPHSEKCQDGEKPRREIAIGGERGEAFWQIADDAREDEDESEETEAVQGRDRTLCFDSVHRLEPGPDVRTETKQPRNITQDEVYSEKCFR